MLRDDLFSVLWCHAVLMGHYCSAPLHHDDAHECVVCGRRWESGDQQVRPLAGEIV